MNSITFNIIKNTLTITAEDGAVTDYTSRADYVAAYPDREADWDALEDSQNQQLITTEQLQQTIVTATQQRLDDFAKTRNYDGILSACTYATSTVIKFQVEGQYCVNARDATWATLYQLFDDVTNGIKPMPASFNDVEPLLPILEWPN